MKIIVVEDEAPIRNGMSKILEKIDRDYELAGTAEDGLEGLELIRQMKPDLVIMDIQMPKMDGLTMLSKARAEGITCRAIVLSAYSDFGYAKQAIELGIENYLLKPIKIPELRRALRQVSEAIAKEESREQLFSLENIFTGAVSGQLTEDKHLNEVLEQKYDISLNDEFVLFMVHFGDNYGDNVDEASAVLEDVGVHNQGFQSSIVRYGEKRRLLMILYKVNEIEKTRNYFQKNVIPVLCSQVKGELICLWKECNGIISSHQTLTEMENEREWNLVFGRGALIYEEKIKETAVIPLKYPLELETQSKQAIIKKDKTEFMNCSQRFREYCRKELHSPKDMKDACIRYCLAIMATAKETGSLNEEVSVQSLLQEIGEAVTWDGLHESAMKIFQEITLLENSEENVSITIQKAQQMIQEYYNQGITLEEIARKLCISEEYLSTQFKKETGKTFSETIRRHRIEKVKELLLKSSLKLNQIADMAGYSDPKYMSKVFKEEVGMLPAEYRKANS